MTTRAMYLATPDLTTRLGPLDGSVIARQNPDRREQRRKLTLMSGGKAAELGPAQLLRPLPKHIDAHLRDFRLEIRTQHFKTAPASIR